MGDTSHTSFSNDLASRVLELELSQELHDIYCHPHWIQFMEMLSNSTCESSLNTLRQWAESHYQLAPLIQWFHRCTAKYELYFDIYSYIPPSRLILQKRCQEKIAYYQEALRKYERKLAYYQELEQMLYDVTDHTQPAPGSSTNESSPSTSCWSILASHTALISDHYSNELRTAPNPRYRKNRTTLPPLETLYLPEVAHTDLTP